MTAGGPGSIRIAEGSDRSAICDLRRRCRLDAEGVLAAGSRWIVARDGAEVVGTAGLEIGGRAALLRSVAVGPRHRRGDLGRQVVERSVDLAGTSGATIVYLFSTGAGSYFSRLGFRGVPVDEVVAALPDAPQVQRFTELGWLASEIAWRLDVERRSDRARRA